MRFDAPQAASTRQCGAEANMAKLLASQASWSAANVCMTTFGGNGFASEYDIERKFRETRLSTIAPVSNNLCRRSSVRTCSACRRSVSSWITSAPTRPLQVDPTTHLLRSWMFVPGHRQRMMEGRSRSRPSTPSCSTLKMAWLPKRTRHASRLRPRSIKSRAGGSARTPARYVRINAGGHERMHADLRSVIRPGLEGLVLPKVETPEQVKTVSETLDRREKELEHCARLCAVARSNRKPSRAFQAHSIAAASPRVIGLIFDEDFGRKTGATPSARGRSARPALRAVGVRVRGFCRQCASCRWRLAQPPGWRWAEPVRAAIAPARLHGNVPHSSVADRRRERSLHAQPSGGRLLRPGGAGL